MVGVGVDGVESELARVCIINQHGNVLLDELAKPERRITDYRTQHSGIRRVAAMPAISLCCRRRQR